MIKKSFRLMLLVAFALSSVMFVACNKYDEEINGLQSQIDQLNATVQSLQSAISNGAVVTSVAETTEGIKVTLSNNQSYVIKHGTNGKDGQNGANGADGKNGSVVTIGENGNWFIDGVDTGKAAQGPKGDNGAAGKDADQVYYYPCTDKESENYGLWVKVTNGVEAATTESWKLEGALVAVYDSVNGVLVIEGVEGATDGRVEIATAAHLASLAFVPEVMTENLGMPVLSSYYISQYAGLDKNKAEVWSKVASNKLEMVYRVNPTNAVLANTAFSFIDRVVKTKVDGDSTNLLNFVGYKAVEGGIEVTATANEINYEAEGNEANLFALKAVNKDGAEIVSDYAKFEYNNLQWFRLACGEYNEKGEFVRNSSHAQWINNPADAEDWNTSYSLTKITDYTKVENIAAIDEAWDMYYIKKHNPNHFAGTFVYTESIDLDDLFQLQTSTNNGWKAVADLNFDVEYKFSMVEKFLGTDGVTDQQTFVEFDEATNVVTVKSSLPSKRSAIGRTPAFKVEAYANGVLVADMYFKVKVLEAKAKESITLWVNGGVIEYSDIVSLAQAEEDDDLVATEVALTWDRVNAEIYEVLGLSATQFNDKYDATVSHIVVENKKGVEYGGTPAGVAAYQYLADNDWGSTNTESAGASIFFDPTALQLGKDTVYVTYNSNDELSYGDVKVAFTYEIVHEKAFPALNTDYKVADNTFMVGEEVDDEVVYTSTTMETVQTKGKLVDGKWVLSNTIKEFIANYGKEIEKVIPGNHKVPTFELKGVVVADTLRAASYAGYTATLNGNTLDSELALYDALKASEDSRLYVITMSLEMLNGETCTKDFAVKFVRPFTMEVGAVELKTMAAPSTADLAKLVTVKDFAGQLLYGKFTKDKKDYYTVTEYATKYYGLTAEDFKFDYKVDAKGFGENTLTVTGSEIKWDNMGGDLQVNKSAKSVVTLTLEGLAVTEAKGDVTVLSTANSME